MKIWALSGLMCFWLVFSQEAGAMRVQPSLHKACDITALANGKPEKLNLAEGWEYYDTVFLEPSMIHSYRFKPIARTLPELWGKSFSLVRSAKFGIGFGTYHIALKAPKIALGIRFDHIHTASKIFVNNDLVFENGVPGTNAASSQPMVITRYYYFNNESDTIHITIQVSNFHHQTGGITGMVSIGTETRIRRMEYQHLVSDIFSINLLLATSLVFLLLFVFRLQDKPQFYFAVLLAIVAARILFHNDALIYGWVHLSFSNAVRFNFFSQNLMAMAIFGYYFTLYPTPRLKIPNIIIAVILALAGGAGFFTHLYDLSLLVYYNQYFLVGVSLYGLIVICVRLFLRKHIAPLFLFAYLLFIVFSILELLYRGSHPELHMLFTLISIFLFVTSQIALLAKRQASLLKKQEEMADELAAANQSLEERVHQRTVMLEHKNKSLQQSKNELEHVVKTKDKLFSIIGHDLRSPLSVINLYSEVLWEECDNDERRKKLNYIINSSTSALHLLENLLIWGKKELGGVKLNPVFVAVDGLISESIQSFHGISESKKIKITSDCDDSVVFADRFVLLLVINNLINNALKFSYPDSEITISSRLISPAPDGKVMISVKDSGVGIEAGTLKKLREGLGNISTRGTADEKGSGLGLLIVKEFTQLNHGELLIESEPGKGSVFSIILRTKMWS